MRRKSPHFWRSPKARLHQQHKSRALKSGNRLEARVILNDLRKRNLPPERQLPVVLGTLRRIDPFVFEELLLHIFDDDGFTVVRNKRYTGDGGIDGKFYFENDLFLIQAKRYKGQINPHHVVEFCEQVLDTKATLGLFIHTGRTGLPSKQAAVIAQDHLTLVSGQKLVDLVLTGDALGLLLDYFEGREQFSQQKPSVVIR